MENGFPHDPAATDGNGNGRGKPRLRKLRFALVVLGLSVLAFVSWIFGIMMAVAQDLPSLETRKQYERSENSVVYDINGEKIATLTNNEGRILLSSEQISPIVKEAVVSIEDQRFYDHRGVDFQGIARAVVQDISSGSAKQGASTITQQFVKNALAAQQDRTVFQKLREAALAYHLERQWSKDKILTEYLNEIYFGEGATGIEAAARTYFGYNHPGCGESDDAPTCASQLFPWEAAMLAGIISSPSAYSPRNFPESALARRNLVLQRMMESGYITEEEYSQYIPNAGETALPEPDDIAPPAENSQAPYFTSWLRQQLVDRYGAGEAFGGGLQVRSTLDLDFQNEVESIAANRLAGIEPTASVVVLDNDTAAVKAMIGGPDFQNAPFNIATNGHRQPGSSFKPFTLVTALEEGISTANVYTSAPQEIPFRVKTEGNNGKEKVLPDLFEVNNYEDQYLGSASLLTATTYSDNPVYAQVGTQVGPADVAETARKMGVETDLATGSEYSIQDGPFEPYNPAIILGGLETGVNTLEMAHAYNTLAADGKRLSGTMSAGEDGPVGIYDVREACCEDDDNEYDPGEGELVPDQTGASGENETTEKQVIDPAVASTAKDVLTTVVTSGTGENAQTGEPTWGKTGTTDDNGDAWFCGATDEITVCVWVGHADSVEPMKTEFAGNPVDGGTYPALIFADVVNAYTSIMDARKAGEDPETDEVDSVVTPPVLDDAAAAAEASPPSTDGGTAEEAAPADTGDSAAGSAAQSGGGLTPE
jgi:penicillin-binding protein 1A